MAVNWNAVGEKTFEAGVDRGMLYLGSTSIPWNGLISVKEKSEGGDLTPYYYEGVVYYVDKSLGNYFATVEAFTYPREFEPYQGLSQMAPGVYADYQPNLKTFDFCYRTMLGNDIDGVGEDYKIHLVYNAIAIPVDRTRNTIGRELSPENFNWDIACVAEHTTGVRPTSHYILDSRFIHPSNFWRIENLLYGEEGASSPPTLPSIQDILIQAMATVNFTVWKDSEDVWGASGSDVIVDDDTFTIEYPVTPGSNVFTLPIT